MTRASAHRVASRFLRAGKVRVEVLKDETEKAIKRFGGNIAVARMLDSVPMFRVMDGEELRSVFGSGEITGGSFSVDGERAFGAQWGSSLPEVAKFGHGWRRSGRLGHELFVAEMDGKDRVFAHLSGFDGELQPDSGVVSVDPASCSTGLGCSFRVKDSEVKQWYIVDENGKPSRISKSDLGKMVSQVGLKPRDVDLWMGWHVTPSDIPKRLINALKYEAGMEGTPGITYRSRMEPAKLCRLLFKYLGASQGSWWGTSMAEATRESRTRGARSEEGKFALTFCLTANVAVPNQGADLKGKTGTVKMVQLYVPARMDWSVYPYRTISRARWENIWQPWGSASFSWKGKNLTVR